MVISTLAAMTAGYLLSVIFGTPKFINADRLLSSFCGKLARRFSAKYQDSEDGQHTGGVFYLVTVLAVTLLPAAVILFLLYWKIPTVAIAVDAVVCWGVMDINEMRRLSQAAARSVRSKNYYRAARYATVLGRYDCDGFEGEDIIRATVQGCADRTVDSAVGPMLCMVLLSGVGGLFFKAADCAADVSGLRAKNSAYFLEPVTKLRDALCFLPGKLTAVIMLVDALFLRLNTRRAERVMRSDSRKCSRPAFGSTRAVLAGLFGISLLPEGVYTAQFMRTYTIGTQEEEPDPQHITLAGQLMLGTAFIVMALLFMVKLTVGVFVG